MSSEGFGERCAFEKKQQCDSYEQQEDKHSVLGASLPPDQHSAERLPLFSLAVTTWRNLPFGCHVQLGQTLGFFGIPASVNARACLGA